MTVFRMTAALLVCTLYTLPAEAGLFDWLCHKHRHYDCYDDYGCCEEVTCCAPEVTCCAPPTCYAPPVTVCAPSCCAPPVQMCAPSCAAPPVCYQAPTCGVSHGCGSYDSCGSCGSYEPVYYDECCPPKRECLPKRLIRAAWAAEYKKNAWFARKLHMSYPYHAYGY